MPEPAVVRAAHLNAYLEAMRGIGVPVEARLGRSGLPTWIETAPDEYVRLEPSLEFVAACGRDMSLAELAFLAAGRQSLASYSGAFRNAVLMAPTGHARVQAVARYAHREDSAVSVRASRLGDDVRIVCDMPYLASYPYLCLVEWLNLHALISIVRSVAGPGWRPSEMTFVSKQSPSEEAHRAFPNTRIRTGQPCASILVDANVLARAAPDHGTQAIIDRLPDADLTEAWTLTSTLRAIVRPYLGEGPLNLDRTAEIFGMSTRTLQRRLRAMGYSYSDIVQQARFEMARELLGDPSVSITDIAYATGYQNPQHFSRAFRRLTGLSPRSFRRGQAPT